MSDNLPANAGSTTMTPQERRASILARARKRKENGEVPQRRNAGVVFANVDGNTGALTAGREKTPIAAEQQFVGTIDTCSHGWRNWQSGKVEKELMIPVLDGGRPTPPEGEPRAGDLPKPRERDGWSETVSLKMSGIGAGSDLDGILVTLDCSNQSSLGQADDLIATIFEQMESEEGQRGLFNPIMTIEIDSYHNKAYSRDVFFPTFKIVAWTDGEETIWLDQISEQDLLN